MNDEQLKIFAIQINRYADWIMSYAEEVKTDFIDLNKLKNLLKTHLKLISGDRKIASELGNFFNSWVIDWDWIAFHITEDYHSYKILFEHINFSKLDYDKLLVYKRIDKNACDMSRRLYLTRPSDINSEPKVFKYNDILNNGSNLGRPETEWKPTIGVTDFGTYKDENDETCLIYDNYYIEFKEHIDDIWDKNSLSFQYSKERKDHLKKISKYIKTEIKDEKGQTSKLTSNSTINISIDGKGLKEFYQREKAAKQKKNIITRFNNLFKKNHD